MRRWKVTVEIQDGWRKDAEGIRNIEKHLWQILIFVLSLYIFLNECENLFRSVIKNVITITITQANVINYMSNYSIKNAIKIDYLIT